MEPGRQESWEALMKELTDRPPSRPSGQEGKDAEWVIERIQDSFDSRAR